MLKIPAIATLLIAGPLPLAAQQPVAVPTHTMTAPVELAADFTRVSAVRELRDGRVLISDSREKLVSIGDFSTKRVQQVSRQGEGPQEYGTPANMFAVGDSIYLQDNGNRRLLVFDLLGNPVRVVAYPERDANGVVPRTPPNFIDARGRYYYLLQTMVGAPGAGSSDELPIVRIDMRTRVVDTLAVIPNPMVMRRDANGFTTGSISAAPFGGRDAWVITEAGNVAVVRASDYHIDWTIDGKRTSFPPIPYTKVPLTEADKNAYRAERARMPVTGIGVGGTTSGFNIPEPDWGPLKGAFGEVIAAPTGEVWVQRMGRMGDPQSYDVIGSSGRVTAHYVVPGGSRVVGFGKGVVFVVRRDSDDLEYVQRYRLP